MNKQLIIPFLLISVIFGFALSLTLSFLISLPYWTLFADGIIHALLFSGITVGLWQIIQYGNYTALPLYQRLINYAALGILCIAVWLAAGYGLFYIVFGKNESELLLNSVWIKGLIGLLMYILSIQSFYCLSPTMQTETDDLIDEIQEEPSSEIPVIDMLERIAVKSGQKIDVVLVPEIIYLQAVGDYVKIHTAKGRFLKEETMKYFQEHLPSKQFVRVHRSYIVNVEMINRIEVYEKQNQLITLKNGEQIKASVTGYKQLKMVLGL